MVILGLDIGYDRCGVCIIDEGIIVFSGLIITDKTLTTSKRLNILRNDLVDIKNKYKPDKVGIEKLFFNRKNIIFEKVCMSKGVALELFCDCEIHEIEPKRIKKEVIGNGDADKKEVAAVLSKLINTDLTNYMDDVVDAIAIAFYVEQINILEKMYNKSK